MSRPIQLHCQLWGWVLFVFSALCFVFTSLRAGDPLGLAGGLLFLLACFVFLAPLLAEMKAAARISHRIPRQLLLHCSTADIPVGVLRTPKSAL